MAGTFNGNIMDKVLALRYIGLTCIFLALLYTSRNSFFNIESKSSTEVAPPINRTSFDSSLLFNRTRCRKVDNLRNILVAVNYNTPHYSSIEIIRKYYRQVFGKIVFCGGVSYPDVIKIEENVGFLGYECVATAIRMYPNYTGYLYTNDDVIMNWWNFLDLDVTKIWTGTAIGYQYGHEFGKPIKSDWVWWKTGGAADLCEIAFNEIEQLSNTAEGHALKLPHYLERFYRNTKNRKMCVHFWSDIFYIPQDYAHIYSKLSKVYSYNNVFLEVAVPAILGFLLNATNNINLNGVYLNNVFGYSSKYLSGEAFYEAYSLDGTFYHPFKLEGVMKAANKNFYQNVVIAFGKVTMQSCKVNSNVSVSRFKRWIKR